MSEAGPRGACSYLRITSGPVLSLHNAVPGSCHSDIKQRAITDCLYATGKKRRGYWCRGREVLSVGGGWDPGTSDRIRTGQEHTPLLCHSNGRGGCVTSRRHRNIRKYGVGGMRSFFLLSFHSVKEEARPLTLSVWMIWQRGRCASVSWRTAVTGEAERLLGPGEGR